MANRNQKQQKINNYFKKVDVLSDQVPNHGRDKRSPAKSLGRRSQRRASSREGSMTQQIEAFPQDTCRQLILVTAMDTINSEAIMRKINKLADHYSKEHTLEVILQNAKYHGGKNVENLKKIANKQFWETTLPKMTKFVASQSRKISTNVSMLPAFMNLAICLTKQQVLLILSQMFFCILPKQDICNETSFAALFQIQQFQIGQNDSKNKSTTRLQKLKCLVNYFNMMFERKDYQGADIEIQRAVNKELEYLKKNRSLRVPLMKVHVCTGEQRIEDGYRKHIMVDFANENIGGGVLTNGSVQQQIMFITFPEAIVAKVLCEKMEDQEAIIIYGAERFSLYQGYSYNFTFAGRYEQDQEMSLEGNSIIVAIDALKYSEGDQKQQYSKKDIRREIHKAFVGFNGAELKAKEGYAVCTGKWGCGAFKANEYAKFLIQWIACSEASRDMIFFTEGKEVAKELSLLVSELQDKTTTDLLDILDQYNNFITKRKGDISLLNYIKDFV